jgi:uncharacterized protein YgiM (DUF1202 family)
MRAGALLLLLLPVVFAPAAAEERHQQVIVGDPYLEMRTGPGRGYPVFHVAERGDSVELLRRRTDWFQVRDDRGEEGWVHYDELLNTAYADGEPFEAAAFELADYTDRRWEAGVLYGDFGGANVISTFGSFGLTPNLTLEMSVSKALGRFSDSRMFNVHVMHIMYPDRRISPYFTLGAGTIHTAPKATLVATIDRDDSTAHAGAGFRMYLTRRFVLRAEYKTYVVFTSRDDNEEIREWKAGFSFFF